MNPVLIDAKGNIIAGHGRVLAARKLGLEEVPCVLHDHLTETQRKAYILADNKMALNAGWDEDMLRLELRELGDMGFDLELTGFGLDEIDELQIEEIEEGLTDEDAVPEAKTVKPGDVWVATPGDVIVPAKMEAPGRRMADSSGPYNSYEGEG